MDLKKIKTLEDLKKLKANFYAQDGKLKKLQNQIRTAPPSQKVKIGKMITQLKADAEVFFETAKHKLEEARIEMQINNEKIDVTYPLVEAATLHPLTLVENRFRTWLNNNGYSESSGLEIETDEYNFEKLNIPLDHPARDIQDSLYISKHKLLRTHNTGLSARELAKNKNKAFAHFVIGPAYRNDEDDATHSHQFMQVDLLAVGCMTFPNLIYTLKKLLAYVFDHDVEIRLRPSYFPFTEPSVEVDIWYNKQWIEVLGAGLLHPNVMQKAGYTNPMTAFAAGIGIERITMIKYGINDIREFYKNDVRFLQQFQGGR